MKVVALIVSAFGVAPFSPQVQQHVVSSNTKITLSSAVFDETEFEDDTLTTEPTIPQQQSSSFKLQDVDISGNLGFDPLGFSQSKRDLWKYREAEIKHSRLAMLAAAGWPISELYDRQIAETFELPPLLDEAGRVPSVLNGGLESVSPVWWGTCLGLTAAIDMYGTAKAESGDPSYTPGKLGFDPLHLYPSDSNPQGQRRLEEAEISNGRLAMMAITGFAVQECTTQMAVIEETPEFFTAPIVPW